MQHAQEADGGAGSQRGGVLEQSVFGTRDLGEIDATVDAFCVAQFGANVAEVLFAEASVGVVRGVVLADGREVVVKAHQPQQNSARLRAVHELQEALHAAGFPCPEPLVGPVALGSIYVTCEALLTDGAQRDTHDPVCRRLIAEALAWHLSITGARPAPTALASGWRVDARRLLWPAVAHSPIFDFDATSAGAEWIDALGACAKELIDPTGPLITGHCDWSAKHFRFAETTDAITAVYDWDSLDLRPETAIVAVAAMTYTTRFDLPGVSRAPTPGEMRAFIDEYDTVRASPLTAAERAQVAAHALLVAAYTARCEHCAIDGYQADQDPDSFTTTLQTHGRAYLRI